MGRTILTADFRDAENGFPALVGGAFPGGCRGRVAEAGGGEGAFGPAVVDAGEMPVYFVGGGVAVELVAHVDEVLHRGYIDVVYRGEVEDDGFEGGEVGFGGYGLAAAGAGVIPGTILFDRLASGGFAEGKGGTYSKPSV